MSEYTLTGKQRNFGKPCAKLLPRDAYIAGCISIRGYRSGAEVRRAHAAEFKAMGGFDGMGLSRAEKRVIKLKKGMSTRAIKRVERMIKDMQDAPALTHKYAFPTERNLQRLYTSLNYVRMQSLVLEVDDRMLANAY